MPHGANEPVESHSVERQPRRAVGPDADFEIVFIDGAEGDILDQQQAKMFLEIARWHAACHDDEITNL